LVNNWLHLVIFERHTSVQFTIFISKQSNDVVIVYLTDNNIASFIWPNTFYFLPKIATTVLEKGISNMNTMDNLDYSCNIVDIKTETDRQTDRQTDMSLIRLILDWMCFFSLIILKLFSSYRSLRFGLLQIFSFFRTINHAIY